MLNVETEKKTLIKKKQQKKKTWINLRRHANLVTMDT